MIGAPRVKTMEECRKCPRTRCSSSECPLDIKQHEDEELLAQMNDLSKAFAQWPAELQVEIVGTWIGNAIFRVVANDNGTVEERLAALDELEQSEFVAAMPEELRAETGRLLQDARNLVREED